MTTTSPSPSSTFNSSFLTTASTDNKTNSPRCDESDYSYDVAPAVIYGLCCVIGIIYTFFGYRLYRLALVVTGFLFGTLIVYLICLEYGQSLSLGANIAISVSVGIVIAVVSILIQHAGRFLVGSHFGIAVAVLLFVIIEQIHHLPSLWIPIGVTVLLWTISGCLTLKFSKTFFIIGTAVIGSSLMVGCLDYFIEKSRVVHYVNDILRATDESDMGITCWYSWVVFACWPFAFLIGLLIQFRVTGYNYDHEEEVQEIRQKKIQKLNLQKLRTEAQQDRQQSHYRHLYQVRRVHGDVISQNFMKNVQEMHEPKKSYTPPPSTPTTLAPGDGITCAESTHTTLSHVA